MTASPHDTVLAAWSRDLAEVMARLDEPALPRALDAALDRLVGFDLSCAFAYPDEREPLLLFDGFRGTTPKAPLEAYLRGTYLFDPFYLACANRIAPGLYRMRSLAPDAFFDSDYYHSPAVHPCISMESGSLSEEIGFLFPLPAGFMAAYSLMRANASPPFSEAEFDRLAAVAPVVRQALAHHWRLIRREPGAPGRPAWSARGDLMEVAFEGFATGLLTQRQQLIVQLILRGHSNAAVGRVLGISEGTAKNHRRAIYERLGVTSQSELFGLFVRHLLAADARA